MCADCPQRFSWLGKKELWERSFEVVANSRSSRRAYAPTPLEARGKVEQRQRDSTVHGDGSRIDVDVIEKWRVEAARGSAR
jgi:hypothetical protein